MIPGDSWGAIIETNLVDGVVNKGLEDWYVASKYLGLDLGK